MTNPTTPEDKVDAILDRLLIEPNDYSLPYERTSARKKKIDEQQARHALLALLNEEHDNTVNEIAGFVYRELGDIRTGDAIKVYAATPKEEQ